MTPDLTHDIVDINVAQINFHYYDLFYAYTNLRERGVQAADEPDVNRFRLIQQATYSIADKNNLGQTWEQVLAERPGIERVIEEGRNCIIESPIGSGSADNGGSTQTRSTQSEWLIDNNFLPITPRGKLYDWQPDIELSPDDDNFGLYFILKLRALKPSKVDHFLDHQLVKNYQSDLKTFARRVKVLIDDHKDLFSLPESILEATTSWFDEQATQSPAVGEPGSGVTWTGSKIDFLKLVYCLHIAGWLNKGKGNRLAVCEELAKLFGVEYKKGDNTLSNSLRGAEKDGNKADLFIDTLRKALKSYISELAVKRDERAAKTNKRNKQVAKKDAVVPKQSRK